MVLAELGGKLRDALRKVSSLASTTTSAGITGASAPLTPDQIQTLLSDISRALIEADVNVKLVLQLRTNLQQKIARELENNTSNNMTQQHVSRWIQKAVMDELVALLDPTTTATGNNKLYSLQRNRSNIVLFVGLQGAGKTTTIAKYAHYYQKRGWKIAMVCADTFRAGALDQLKQNATKLRIPFYGSYTQADPVVIAQEGVALFTKHNNSKGPKKLKSAAAAAALAKSKTSANSSSSSSVLYELILVDTSGRHQQESSLLEEMQEIATAIRPDTTILVMDATQGQAVFDQARAFSQAVPVGSVIITKLDGHAKGGGALSAVAATGAPISFLATGEHFDDLEPFVATSFCSKLLGLGDVRGLMEAFQNVTDTKSQQALMQKVQKGEGFTLRDMYNQFQNVLNMGPLNKMMGMLPGMPEYLLASNNNNGGNDEATNRLKKFLYIMDSMTSAELDGKVNFSTKPSTASGGKSTFTPQPSTDAELRSRVRRIAAGSGTSPNDVQILLLVHEQMAGVMNKMGKSGLAGGPAGAAGAGGATKQQQQLMAQQLRKNPQLIHQRLNQMDPRIIQQMGGREQVMAMMQQMAKGGPMVPQPTGAPGASESMMSRMMPPAGGFPGLPPGMDMEQMMKMAQAMGMGGGGGGGAPPGAGMFPPEMMGRR